MSHDLRHTGRTSAARLTVGETVWRVEHFFPRSYPEGMLAGISDLKSKVRAERATPLVVKRLARTTEGTQAMVVVITEDNSVWPMPPQTMLAIGREDVVKQP